MKKKLLLLSLVLTGIFQLHAQKRFANKIIDVSREYNSYPGSWCASQILGSPNVYPNFGDIAEAWTPENYGDQRDTLILSFKNNGPIDSIFVYETDTPGFIDSVWVKNPGTELWDLVYTAVPATAGSVARILAIGFPMTAYNVSEIKITTATDLATDWVEIDAVAISPGSVIAPQINNAGNSIVFDGVNDKFQTLLATSLALSDSSKTVSAWVKIDGTAPVVSDVYFGAGILVDGNYGKFGIYFSNLNGVDSIYFYNEGTFIGMDFIMSDWMHIACTHDGDTLRAYKNGVLYRSIYSAKTNDLGSFMEIGHSSLNDQYFTGEIESVSIYNRGLTTNEIREAMHVTPNGNEMGLTGHFNFNESMNEYSIGHDSMAVGLPVLQTSVLPIGNGSSDSEIENTGSVVFNSTDFSANYSIQNMGQVTASKLDGAPYSSPTGTVVGNVYWVVNQFNGTTFTADFTFSTVENLATNIGCNYKLYSRSFNASGAWSLVSTSTVVTANSVAFEGLTDNLGQFVIMQDGICDLPTNITNAAKNEINIAVYPNPSSGIIFIEIPVNENGNIKIYNNLGQEVYSNNSQNHNLQVELPQGVYFINFNTDNASVTKKVIITQ